MLSLMPFSSFWCCCVQLLFLTALSLSLSLSPPSSGSRVVLHQHGGSVRSTGPVPSRRQNHQQPSVSGATSIFAASVVSLVASSCCCSGVVERELRFLRFVSFFLSFFLERSVSRGVRQHQTGMCANRTNAHKSPVCFLFVCLFVCVK